MKWEVSTGWFSNSGGKSPNCQQTTAITVNVQGEEDGYRILNVET